ncbi:hypothetical protein PG995_009148 [Apiospora arundinis]
MATDAEESIMVGSPNSIATTIAKPTTAASKRSTRVTKPTAKIQEASNRPVSEDGDATKPESMERVGMGLQPRRTSRRSWNSSCAPKPRSRT